MFLAVCILAYILVLPRLPVIVASRRRAAAYRRAGRASQTDLLGSTKLGPGRLPFV